MALRLRYAQAVLTAVGPRSSTLPDTVLTSDVTVDRARLAGYARVCGFRVEDALPGTYPHVLGFPLQMELMARRSFPFALPGLVHVRNTITAHRALDAAEPLHLAVHAEGLRSHPKGAQVDLVTAVDVAGERVWEGRSTYLARGAPSPDGPAPDGPADPEPPAGLVDGPPAALWRVGADTGRRYAAVSGDVNPIHLSPVAAKAFGFPRAIAHGMWTAAHALAALDGRLPGALHYDVAFVKPLLLPSRVELRTRAVDGGWDLGVRAGPTPHLAAAVRPR